MNISVNIDCTPEEARRFLGLPDLAPIHELYLSRVTAMMADGVTPETIEGMVRSWAPLGDAGLNFWQRLVDQMVTPAGK